jgi:hypothetical protein
LYLGSRRSSFLRRMSISGSAAPGLGWASGVSLVLGLIGGSVWSGCCLGGPEALSLSSSPAIDGATDEAAGVSSLPSVSSATASGSKSAGSGHFFGASALPSANPSSGPLRGVGVRRPLLPACACLRRRATELGDVPREALEAVRGREPDGLGVPRSPGFPRCSCCWRWRSSCMRASTASLKRWDVLNRGFVRVWFTYLPHGRFGWSSQPRSISGR